MKKAILLFATVMFAFAVSAQSNVIEEHFQNYSDSEEFTKVNVTGKMFDLVSEIESDDEDMKEMVEMAMQIDELNIIVSEEVEDALSEYESSIDKMGSRFEILMSVEDKEGDATFYVDENDGVISEFVIIAHGEKEFVIVSLTGSIELSKISQIMKEVNMDSYMHKTSIDDIDKFKVYPNPLTSNDNLTVELPEEMIGFNIFIYDASGKEVHTQKAGSDNETISMSGYETGFYILKIENDDFSINRRFTVQ